MRLNSKGRIAQAARNNRGLTPIPPAILARYGATVRVV